MSNKSRICSRCGVTYDNSLRQCPVCHKLNSKFFLSLFIYIIFLVVFIFKYNLPERISIFYNALKTVKTSEAPVSAAKNVNEDVVNLPTIKVEKIMLRPMSELSYLPVSDILNKRVEYVNSSIIFGNQDYQPSPEVFEIEDGLPWISAEQITKYGTDNNPDIGIGDSRHSLSINNPELMFVFLMCDYSRSRDSKYASEADYMLPYKMYWDKANKIISVKFKITPFFKQNPFFHGITTQLEDTNARDLGYKWAYCDKYEKIKFKEKGNNISTDVYELQGYYHKGFACGLESGCNNYSPNQPPLHLAIYGKGFISIKLWKEKPASKDDKADLTYLMYLT